MSELIRWFGSVQPLIERPRARNYTRFVTALLSLDKLLEQKATMSAFIEILNSLPASSSHGYESKPGVVLIRKRFDWVNGRGFLDLAQATNATKRPFTQDALLAMSTYHIPSRRWDIGFFAEAEGTKTGTDTFPFPLRRFHALSFQKKPEFGDLVKHNPCATQTLRELSVARRGKVLQDTILGECFVRRITRGPALTNMAFPHL